MSIVRKIDSIEDHLKSAAREHPDRSALVGENNHVVTYSRLYSDTEDICQLLRSSGYRSDDVIALVVANGSLMIEAIIGCMKACICAPLMAGFTSQEYRRYLFTLNATAVVIDSVPNEALSEAARELDIALISLVKKNDHYTISGSKKYNRGRRITKLPADTALLLFSSGTTADPKLIPLTKDNISWSASCISRHLLLGSDDCCLCLMPAFHVHGLIGAVFSTFISGGRVVFPAQYDGDLFDDLLRQHRVTWYSAVPTIHQEILTRSKKTEKQNSDHYLRFIRSSSSPLNQGLMTGLENCFKVPVIEAYGMTECSHQLASNYLPPGERKSGSVGKAIGCDIAIFDHYGNAVIDSDTVGEIAVKGRGVTPGYLNTENQQLENGWLLTGDLGYLDDSGFLFITGRIKEIINRGGEKISPAEIDRVLIEHPEVLSAACFGMKHETLEEIVAAAVILITSATVTESELRQFMRIRIAAHKVPDKIFIVTEIPQTVTGKPIRQLLSNNLATEAKGNHQLVITDYIHAVHSVWKTILCKSELDLKENFFVAGGDSLKAMRVVSALQEKYNVDLAPTIIFDSPTIESLANWLQDNLCSKPVATSEVSEWLPVPGERPQTLSYAQERLWILGQFDGASPLYNISYNVTLRGMLDSAALECALQDIVQRHEVLRTAILADSQGRPYQQIRQDALTLNKVDLAGSRPEQRRHQLGHLVDKELRSPFDMSSALKIRATLLTMNSDEDAEEFVLLLTLHHIASDGWSMGIFREELGALYLAHSTGTQATLPHLPIQYADFSTLQRRWLDNQVMDNQLDYWTKQLSGAPALLELPTDHPRPALQRFEGRSYGFTLSAELSQRLHTIACEQGATLYMILLSAFYVLLSRYSEQDDIVVGSPIANRTRVEVESLIGFFANTLVLRTDLSGEISFSQLLRRVRDTTISAYEHQDLPFEKLVEKLQPTRSMSFSPLFQVMFVLQNTPGDALSMQGLCVETSGTAEHQGLGMAKFDLTLSIEAHDAGLNARLRYNTDLFEPSTIERMAEHFQVLLAGIVESPDCLVSHLPLLSERERQQLLVEWNDTTTEFPRDQCVHESFEAQVLASPDAIALEFNNDQLTYQQLNERANQQAHYLIESAIYPGQLVGICLERSFDMIASILAVLKVGGAYIPVDPYLPATRLEFILNDSGCACLLTTRKWESILSGTSAKRIFVDSMAPHFDRQPHLNPSLDLRSSRLAYIIYTSGSTGAPKGAMITHRNLSNYFHWRQTNDLITPTDRVLQKTTLGFDVASSEIFAPLLTGATVVLAPADIRNELDTLAQLIVDAKITHLHVPPSYLRLLVEDEYFVKNNRLIRLFSGGEEMSVSLRNRTLKMLDVRVLNGYGPTEATISVLFHECRVSDRAQSVSIGQPIANTQLYILDRQQQLVPAGHSGELYIGGECVGEGYLNREELSTERFVDNPFGSGKIYKSGDLVRYLPIENDAQPSVEFLGRTDDQVQVRGFRVELGEIKAALDKHSAVLESVTLYDDDAQRLITYYTASEAVTTSTLRHYLLCSLPEHAVPSVFIQLDTLPLNHNGKIDRVNLPCVDLNDAITSTPHEVPATQAEQLLASIWSTLLGVEQVGRHDNFFELGGHSLLAIQLINQIKETFLVDIPLLFIFEYLTISELAEAIENSGWVIGENVPLLDEYGEEGEL